MRMTPLPAQSFGTSIKRLFIGMDERLSIDGEDVLGYATAMRHSYVYHRRTSAPIKPLLFLGGPDRTNLR